jgi:hypothetical protein
MKRLIVVCATILIMTIPTQAQLVNGGFETGDLTGWTFVPPAGGDGGFAGAVTSHTDPSGSGTTSWAPSEGSYFGLLKTNGAGSHAQLYQTFYVSTVGATLTLDYFWDSEDYYGYDDSTVGAILSGAGTGGAVVATLFSHSVDTDPADYWGTPWTTVSYTFASPGTYTLLIEIYNGGDSGLDSYVGADAAMLKCPVDIKPGSWPNSINLKSKGVIPVAILGSDVFDVSMIDTDSLWFMCAWADKWAMEDVNWDGYMDLIVHFRTQDTCIGPGDTVGEIDYMYDGVWMWCYDTIRIVPKDKD